MTINIVHRANIVIGRYTVRTKKLVVLDQSPSRKRKNRFFLNVCDHHTSMLDMNLASLKSV